MARRRSSSPARVRSALVVELERLADLLAAPIVKPLLGKATVPDDSPFTTGGVEHPGHGALRGRDGRGRHPVDGWHELSISGVLPETRQVPRRADRPRSVAHRAAVSVEVGLCGDAKATLQVLMPHLHRREDRAFLEQAQAGMKGWRRL